MDNILHRIAKIAELQKTTIGGIEKKIGASKGVLSRAINNNTDIQSKWIVLLAENYPSISHEWLLTGRGDMLKGEVAITAPEDLAVRLRDKEEIILALKAVIATQEDYIAELKKGFSPRVSVAKSVAR